MAMQRAKKVNGGDAPRATTAQILGAAGKSIASVDPRWRQHFNTLIALRADLSRRKETHNETARQQEIVFSLHMADAGTDEFDRDFALSMISSDQNALYEIEQALNRIREGTFGICEITGKTIEPERLEAIPWARFSAEAQRELEQTNAVHRPRLGARGSINEPASATEEAEGETGE